MLRMNANRHLRSSGYPCPGARCRAAGAMNGACRFVFHIDFDRGIWNNPQRCLKYGLTESLLHEKTRVMIEIAMTVVGRQSQH